MDFLNIDGDILDSTEFGLEHDSGLDSGLDLVADLNLDYIPDAYAYLNNQYNIPFTASPNADGYIPDGNITLDRTFSDKTDSFPHYTKDGHDFVKVGSRYIQVDSGNTVTINNVKYDTI